MSQLLCNKQLNAHRATLFNIADIVKSPDKVNAHVWLENDKGHVLDYSDDALRNCCYFASKTSKVVRKEFSKELQAEISPHIARITKRLIKNNCMRDKVSYKYYYMNTPGFCMARVYLEKTEPGLRVRTAREGYKIKIGSLGFEQPDGGVFWEYG